MLTAALLVLLPLVPIAAPPHAVIRIVHPGGERGSLWGREVHDWLVALGVPPARLAILAGGPRDDAVLLRVVPAP